MAITMRIDRNRGGRNRAGMTLRGQTCFRGRSRDRGLATADAPTRVEICCEILDLAQRSMREGKARIRSTAKVIAGSR